VLELVGELPDLWDLKTFGQLDSSNARYAAEGYQEPYVAFAKRVTSKPVVGVGRFTSPDAMVSQIRRGVLDLIGAARPSIADPFLPRKIDEGREDDIRECIGCNICYACYHESVPIRCTQNPTMGEEWRRGWHPERIPPRASDDPVLVVGGGPAGLEAARALGQRGYPVTLAEERGELGGRLLAEARLPGFATWMRVRDWRRSQIEKMPNVEVFLGSRLEPSHVLELGAPHVVIATGARWLRAISDINRAPLFLAEEAGVLTPDDLFAGAVPADPVLIYDFDLYYLGSALAEQLALAGHRVTYVTNADRVSEWSRLTHDQWYAQMRLLELEVTVVTGRYVIAFAGGEATTRCKYTGVLRPLPAATLVPIGLREPDDELYRALVERPSDLEAAGVRSLRKVGDCEVPGAIVHAVYAAHKLARELDAPARNDLELDFKLERSLLDEG
jgi:dimethylamine/trimethylamine dehydrogenase